jgi:glutamate dehydrogenase/leucine dehydrogenase
MPKSTLPELVSNQLIEVARGSRRLDDEIIIQPSKGVQLATATATTASPTSLDGHTILITGAGSGIGGATARLVAAAGAHVITTDLAGHKETAAITEAGLSTEAQHPGHHRPGRLARRR